MIERIIVRNWKGIAQANMEIRPRMVLTGPNGSRKSAILEAVSFALTGYTHLGKKPSATMELASGNSCEVTVSDGKAMLTRKLTRKGASVTQEVFLDGVLTKEADLVIPAGLEIPVEAIHPAEFLALSGDKRAAWLFGSLGNAILPIRPGLITGKYKWFELPMDATVLLEKLAEEAKTTKAEMERCVANIQKLMGQDVNLPPGNLKEWESNLIGIERDLEQATKDQAANVERSNLVLSRQQTQDKIKAQIAHAQAKITTTEARIKELQGKLVEEQKGPGSAIVEKLREVLSELRREASMIEAGIAHRKDKLTALANGCCPTCGASGEILADVRDAIDLQIANLDEDLEAKGKQADEIKAQIGAEERRLAAIENNRQVRMAIKVEQDAMASYRKSMEGWKADLAAGENQAGQIEAVSPEILQAKIDGLKQRQNEAKAAIKAFTSSGSVKSFRAQAEDDRQKLASKQDQIKADVATVKKIRDESLESVTGAIRAPFDQAVKVAFGVEPFFRVLDSKGKPEVSFGIVRDGREIGFDTLSGGERTVILAALIAAVQIAKGAKAPKLALIEMAEADHDRLRAVAAACDAMGFEQVLLATCHHPGLEIAPGWLPFDMARLAGIVESTGAADALAGGVAA